MSKVDRTSMRSLYILWLVCGSLMLACEAEDGQLQLMNLSRSDQNPPEPEGPFKVMINIREFVIPEECDGQPDSPLTENKVDDKVVSDDTNAADAESKQNSLQVNNGRVPEEVMKQVGKQLSQLYRLFDIFKPGNIINLYKTNNQDDQTSDQDDQTNDQDEQTNDQDDEKEPGDLRVPVVTTSTASPQGVTEGSCPPFKVKLFLGSLIIIILLYFLITRVLRHFSQNKNNSSSDEGDCGCDCNYQDLAKIKSNACNYTNRLLRSGRREIILNLSNKKLVQEV